MLKEKRNIKKANPNSTSPSLGGSWREVYLFQIVFISSFSFLNSQTYTLNDCLTLAEKNHLQIKELQISQKVAENELKIQKNKQLPLVSSTLNNGFTSGFQQVFSGSILGEYKLVNSYSNQLTADVSVDIWQKNAQKIKIENEKINVFIASLQVEKSLFELKLEVIARYFSLLIIRERKEVAKRWHQHREIQIEKSEKSYKNGNLPLKDWLQSKADASQDLQNLQTQINQEQQRKMELAQLLLIEDYKNIDVLPIQEEISTLKPDEILIERHPAFLIEQEKTKLQENQTKYWKSQYYPKLSLNYRTGTSSQQILEQKNLPLTEQFNNNFFQNVFLTLQIPVFNQNTTRLNVQKSKLNQQIQQLKTEQEKIKIRNQIQQLQQEIEASEENYKVSVENEKRQKEAFELTEKSYEIGKITRYEVELARNNLIISELTKIQMKYEMLFKQKQLETFLTMNY
jgi:outer membrane protein